MTLSSTDNLFSHPETHSSHASTGASHHDQPAWTNLFQEPLPEQRTSTER